jgi:hypothetical protein
LAIARTAGGTGRARRSSTKEFSVDAVVISYFASDLSENRFALFGPML